MKQGRKEWNGVNIRLVILILITVILSALAILSLASAVKGFCTVGVISVEGEDRYTEEMILSGLWVEKGDWLYELDTEEICDRMLREYPFLLDIELRPDFPGRLTVLVTERFTPWYVEISGAKYALNENLLVIDAIEDTEGMTSLILPDVQRVIAGSVPAFSKDETELRKTLEIIDTIRSVPFWNRMTVVDVSNRWEIGLVIDGKISVALGNMNELSYKLEKVGAVLASDARLAEAESGEIYAKNPSEGIAVSVKMPPSTPEDSEETQTS